MTNISDDMGDAGLLAGPRRFLIFERVVEDARRGQSVIFIVISESRRKKIGLEG